MLATPPSTVFSLGCGWESDAKSLTASLMAKSTQRTWVVDETFLASRKEGSAFAKHRPDEHYYFGGNKKTLEMFVGRSRCGECGKPKKNGNVVHGMAVRQLHMWKWTNI
uniref:Uncharacterized protein n=1 Tax=Lotharella globosa TaxID=91324 RepID=A0A7S4DU67_9EUKA